MAKLPSSSEGPHAPTSSQAPVMADSSPAITLVTSRPVPAVSAPTSPASSVLKNSALALDDLPPPPPPAEPYEVFLARVQRDVSSLPVRSTQPGAAVPPRPAVATPTTGSRLPTPFPRFEDSSWALQPQAPNIRIRMPLHPVTCLLHRLGCGPDGAHPLTRPWSVVLRLLRCRPVLLDLVDLQAFSQDLPLFLHLQRLLLIPKRPPPPPPPCFRGFFPGATPPFIPTAPSYSVNTVAPTLTQQDAGTFSQGPAPKMIKGWKEEFMVDMRACWKQFVGDAPPQPTVGPAVTLENMGPDPLRQLSPSDDREASRAQHKTGSK